MNWLVAVSLLVTPADTPEVTPTEDFPSLRECLVTLAVEWELLDPRETTHTFTQPADFLSDLDLMRRRYAELRDAPRVVECLRYPPRWYAEEMMALNREVKRYVETIANCYPAQAGECGIWLRSLDASYHYWDLVRDAQVDYYHTTVRRRALRLLKEME